MGSRGGGGVIDKGVEHKNWTPVSDGGDGSGFTEVATVKSRDNGISDINVLCRLRIAKTVGAAGNDMNRDFRQIALEAV